MFVTTLREKGYAAVAIAASVCFPAKYAPAETPLIQDIARVRELSHELANIDHSNPPEPSEKNLQEVVNEYLRTIDKQTYSYLHQLYSAEAAGNVHVAGVEPGRSLETGKLYRVFSGYTVDGEIPPDKGPPGRVRVAKRLLVEGSDGKITRVDVNEAFAVTLENDELVRRLEEIRVHFNSESAFGPTGQIFNRFHVSYDANGKAKVERRPSYSADNTPLHYDDSELIALPHSCIDCHVGLVENARTHDLTRYAFPSLSDEERDEISLQAFNEEAFIPDGIFLSKRSLGEQELRAKFKLSDDSMVAARQLTELLELAHYQTPGLAEVFSPR